MAGVNKVILVGNLGQDPELRYTASGTPVVKLRIATSRKWTDRDGNRQEKTEWHSVTAWRKLAEICAQYLSKGRQVYIEGELQNDTWEQDGVKRYSYSIQVREMVMLGGNRGNGGEAGSGENESNWPDGTPVETQASGAEDDIPF
jgi:single-strand DNA-binding protein